MLGARAAAALLAACGGLRGAEAPARIAGPKEITWSFYQLGEARQKLWDETFRMAAQATGVKINVTWEPGQDYWNRAPALAAAATLFLVGGPHT